MSFDAGSISAKLVLNRDDFTRGLTQAKADADKWAKGDYTAKLKANADDAKARTAAAQAAADKYGHTTSTATLKANTSGADASIARTKKNAEGLGSAFAKVPASIGLITAALPSAIALTGELSGVVIGAGGAFASAGIAAVSFGAVAKTMFSQTEAAVKKVTAAQAALAKASTPTARLAALKAEKQALDELTPSELKLYGAVKGLSAAWKEQNAALQPEVWKAVQPYIATATRSLSLLPLILPKTSAAIQGVGVQLRTLMNSGTTTQFAQFIGGTGSKSLGAGGSFLVNTLKTLEELLPQFRPLIDGADQAIVRWGQDMARWAGSSSAHNGIQSFLQWIHDNAGQAEDFLKNLAGAIVNIGKAGASGGVGELRVLSDVLSGIAKLPPNILGPVVTSLTAISLLSKIGIVGKGLNAIGSGLVGLAGKATGVSAAATALKTLGGAANDASVAEKGLAAVSGALDAITPLGWVILAGAGVAALAYGISKLNDGSKTLTQQIIAQNHATGYNIAGYQAAGVALGNMSKQLSATRLPLVNLHTGVVQTTTSVGQFTGQSDALTAAQKRQQDKARELASAMEGLSGQYGIGFKQAKAAAIAAGINADAWTGSAQAADKARAKFAAYVLTNEHALPKQQEENALMRAFGSAANGSASQISSLDTSFRLLVGDFVSKQEAMLNAKSAIQQFGSAARQTGADTVQTRQQFFGAVDSIHQYADTLLKAHTPAAKFYADVQRQITALQNAGPLTRSERTALQGLQQWMDKAAGSQQGLTGRQQDWIKLTNSSFLPVLSSLGANTKNVRTDMSNLADSIAKTGTKSESTKADRAQLIEDLSHTQLGAKGARTFVNELTTSLGKVPKSVKTKISVTGTGSYHLTETQKIIGSLGGNKPVPGLAAGGRIRAGTTPTADDVLIRASKDETVVSAAHSRILAPSFAAVGVPGYAAGGIVGSYAGTAPGLGKWAQQEVDDSVTVIEKSVAGATAAAIKAALKAVQSIAGATTTAIGDLPANYRAIATFLTGHGYSHTGASGIAGNILQESGGNPESAGSGGNGLIGWTPARAGFVTGNPGRDLAVQLNAILAYNNAQGGISTLNAQPTAASAAAYYMSHFERPAVATENAERREAGANAVFKAMGYASGTTGAKPGWAKVGENGQELVHFHGGETVLPASLTSRVLSTGVVMPGYADGTIGKKPVVSPPKLPGPVSPYPPSGGGKRAKDEAELKKLQNQLAALEKTATAHLKKLRLPIDREQLYLLQHPGISDARKKQLEAQISRQESAVSKYRKKATAGEDKLDKEITLLKKIIAGDPKGKPPPLGKLPPGIGKLNQKQDLALLAKDVAALAALKKTATAKLKTLNRPVQEDELYLLTHPGLGAGKKAAIEAALKKAQAAVRTYRKKVTGQEDTYTKTISLLRSLTGNPKDPKYGGAGSTDSGSGSGDDGSGSGGTSDSGPPPGQFVGTLPLAPSSGGADITGGGSGGLGGTGSATLGLPGLAVPAVTAGPAMSQFQAYAAAAASQSGSQATADAIVQHLATLVQLARTNPAATGGHLGTELNSRSRSALSSARWSASPAPFA